MKDSGIKWIGMIPDNWETKSIRQVLNERIEKNSKHSINTILSLSAKEGVTLYSSEGHSGNKPREDLSDYKIVRENDIVVNSMNILSGSVGLSRFEGVVSPVYYVYYKKHSEESIEFYNYIFKCKEFQTNLRGLGNGILIRETESGNLNTIRTRVPSKKLSLEQIPYVDGKTQQNIVKYLNKKCFDIDTLIALENEQIDRLTEYKNAVIRETVTKGLAHNVPMKDSGIEWIGLVPESFKIDRIKSRIHNHFSGCWGEDSQFAEFNLPRICIRIADFDFERQNAPSAKTIRYYSESQIRKAKLIDGDIILEKSGGGDKTPVGRCVIFDSKDYENREVLFANFCECLRPKNVNSRFLAYSLKAFYLTNDMHLFFNQTTGLQNLDVQLVLNEKMVFPCLNEQEKIVQFLDKKCSEINEIIDLKNAKIANMLEYKKAIIYEYVTGKREVAP